MSKQIPQPLRDAADSLFQHTLTLLDDMPVPAVRKWDTFIATHTNPPADEDLVRCYLNAVSDERQWIKFRQSALRLSAAIESSFGVAAPRRVGGNPPLPGLRLPKAASDAPRLPVRLHERLLAWQRKLSLCEAMWIAWKTSAVSAPVPGATAQTFPLRDQATAASPAILSDAERNALNQLLAAATMRADTTEAVLPSRLLRRWSVPLLIGPSGSGKAYVCEEFARRRGWAYRSWQVNTWMLQTNRVGNTTLDQVFRFIEDHRGGCVIYLAGLDTLAASTRAGDQNASYMNGVIGEVEYLLDLLSARSLALAHNSRTGETFAPRLMMVAGGRFPGLWGEVGVGSPADADAWQIADSEPLSGPTAVAAWLSEHGGMPVGILRRLSAEPLVLPRITAQEAQCLARSIQADLPASLDGLGVEQITSALSGLHGWRGVAALVEQSLCAGSDLSAGPDTEAPSLAK